MPPISYTDLMKVFSLILVSWTSFSEPLVIGHRGASGYLPEHTLEAYQLAIDQGADFIEPDLVMTKDGQLIARHENAISDTTNVSQVFPKRKTSKTIDGQDHNGWFSEDFTLEEIRQLRAKQRLSFREQKFNGQYQIPTFEEVLQLARDNSKRLGKTIGVYPEIKHSTYSQSIGLPMEKPVVELLKKYGFNGENSMAFVQSFEVENLKTLNRMTKVPLIQLVYTAKYSPVDSEFSYGDMVTPEGLKKIKEYADGIGIPKSLIFDENQKMVNPQHPLLVHAKKLGLKIHVYTFRNEEIYRPKGVSAEQELLSFFQAGVDGVFSDFPDTAHKTRLKHKSLKK